MALHGTVKVNGDTLYEWSAQRKSGVVYEVNEYRVVLYDSEAEVVKATDMAHEHADGALVLAAKVLTWAAADVKSDHHPVCAKTGAWVNGCICVDLYAHEEIAAREGFVAGDRAGRAAARADLIASLILMDDVRGPLVEPGMVARHRPSGEVRFVRVVKADGFVITDEGPGAFGDTWAVADCDFGKTPWGSPQYPIDGGA